MWMRIEIEWWAKHYACTRHDPASFLLSLPAAVALLLLFDLHNRFCFLTNLPILWPFDLCPVTWFCVAAGGHEVSTESLFCPAELDSLFSYFDASGQRSSKYRTTPSLSCASSSSITLFSSSHSDLFFPFFNATVAVVFLLWDSLHINWWNSQRFACCVSKMTVCDCVFLS